jgi:hypothetical protein
VVWVCVCVRVRGGFGAGASELVLRARPLYKRPTSGMPVLLPAAVRFALETP